MKSKTILSEEERIGQGKYNDFNYPLLLEKYHKALVAAEEEITHKDLIIKGYIFNEEQFESEISSLKKEVESLKDILFQPPDIDRDYKN